jgi:pimeloyl-ACP methyl ester carboxylesterase
MILFNRIYGEGSPLVILHGLFGQSDNWTTLARAWSNHHQVIAIDQRNHGQSPHEDAFSYELMAEDLAETLDALNIASVNLLGHSMGGKTAMFFAQQHPQRISKLIVADIAPRAYAPHHGEIIAELKTLPLTELKDRNSADVELAKGIPDFGTRQFLLKNLYRNDAGTFSWRFNLEAISAQISEVGKALPDEQVHLPALFVRGSKSNYISDEDQAEIAQQFSNATFATIPNAGHWLHAEQPEAFSRVVLDFLQQ